MTTVINLFGGPGCGKSTIAASLFSIMKKQGKHVELVREYCKYWVWHDRKVREWDHLYLLGKQSAYESMLYDKVDYVVTDSPLLLAGIYQELQSNGEHKYVGQAAKAFMKHAQSKGVLYQNYVLERNKPYDQRGRWEDENEAARVDEFIRSYLAEAQVPFENILASSLEGKISVLDRVVSTKTKTFSLHEIWWLKVSPCFSLSNPHISHVIVEKGFPQVDGLWRVIDLKVHGPFKVAKLISMQDPEIIITVPNLVPDDLNLARLFKGLPL